MVNEVGVSWLFFFEEVPEFVIFLGDRVVFQGFLFLKDIFDFKQRIRKLLHIFFLD